MKTVIRCPWVTEDKIYINYHDEEWGVPIYDDTKLFECLTLESAQAGLSWITVLKKRGHYRKVYDGFDPKKVASYDDQKIEALMQDTGIIRNRLKICASINNAKKILEIQQEFGSFSSYLWGFVGRKPIRSQFESLGDYPSKSNLSDLVSKDLKDKGFKFIGSTIIYAFMQAVGILNDHTISCFRV
jgi:DNA-3-methyladenine glycosylase I